MIKRCDLSRYEEELLKDISPYDKEYFEWVEVSNSPFTPTVIIPYGYRDVQQGEGGASRMGPWLKIKDLLEAHK